jgi:hypothetical protein
MPCVCGIVASGAELLIYAAKGPYLCDVLRCATALQHARQVPRERRSVLPGGRMGNLTKAYEEVIAPLTEHQRGRVHPSFLSIESNIIWNKLIPSMRDDPVPSLIDTQPSHP